MWPDFHSLGFGLKRGGKKELKLKIDWNWTSKCTSKYWSSTRDSQKTRNGGVLRREKKPRSKSNNEPFHFSGKPVILMHRVGPALSFPLSVERKWGIGHQLRLDNVLNEGQIVDLKFVFGRKHVCSKAKRTFTLEGHLLTLIIATYLRTSRHGLWVRSVRTLYFPFDLSLLSSWRREFRPSRSIYGDLSDYHGKLTPSQGGIIWRWQFVCKKLNRKLAIGKKLTSLIISILLFPTHRMWELDANSLDFNSP